MVDVVAPVAAYVPAVASGQYVYTSGQLPMRGGVMAATGKVGADVMAEQATELAAQCALNALAAIKSVVGDLDLAHGVGFNAGAHEPNLPAPSGDVRRKKSLTAALGGAAAVRRPLVTPSRCPRSPARWRSP